MSDKDNQTEKQTMGFQTEVSQILHLVTHSLYSHKEIFLRELIANASDAIDKLKFLSLSDESLYGGDSQLGIKIDFDSEKNTITLSDNGIGMDKNELVDNLGTIAKSGTKAFFNQLSGDASKDSELIGQFGVGFYSAFIVADKVEVHSLKAGLTEAWQWSSDGKSNFELSASEKSDRGTSITLFLKEGESEFTNRWTLQNIINKYADHISVPVELWQDPVEEQKDEEGNVTQEAKAGKFEQVNKAKALWLRSKNDISDEEYQSFYQHISNDFQDAITWTHNKVEGKLEYTSLLFIPKKAPFDMFQRESKQGLKLFVQRVFIMDDADQFLPNYLRFVKGVIDSNDLPLNVSREILQDSSMTRSLKKACTKRVLSLLNSLSNQEDTAQYDAFWKEFGNALKEGIGEDFANKEEIAKLLRFTSRKNQNTCKTSLSSYLERMPEKQDKIYYLVADSEKSAQNSPHLEIFEKNNVEVLLMWEPIDEWMMGNLNEFDSKSFESINQTDITGDLFKQDEAEEEKTEEQKAQSDNLVQIIKDVLGDKVSEVRESKRLTKTPSCVVLAEGGMTNQMAQIMKASGHEVPQQKYIFEINTNHNLVKQIDTLAETSQKDWINVLFDQALLAENGGLEDTSVFIETINRLLSNK